jgi:hypothetical protein
MKSSKWPAAGVLAVLLGALACDDSNDGGSSENTEPSNDALSADEALCENHCRDLEEAGCGCRIGCDAIIDSLGDCIDSWRALTECLTQVGFTCTDNKVYPQQNSCSGLLDQHAECVARLANRGSN